MTSRLGDAVDSGQGWVDTCAMVSDCMMGRGDRRGKEENQFSRLGNGGGGDSYAVAHTDIHNFFGSTVIFSLSEIKSGLFNAPFKNHL